MLSPLLSTLAINVSSIQFFACPKHNMHSLACREQDTKGQVVLCQSCFDRLPACSIGGKPIKRDIREADQKSERDFCGPSLRISEHVRFEPGVAERAARIEPLHQANKVGMACVELGNWRRVCGKDVAGVWTRCKRGQGVLNLEEHLLDRL